MLLQLGTKIILFALALTLAASCASPEKTTGRKTRKLNSQISKAGTKESTPVQKEPMAQETKKPGEYSAEELNELIYRHSEITSPLTDSDRLIVSAIGSKQHISVTEEAVLTLAVLKEVLSHSVVQTKSFQEEDFNKNNGAKTDPAQQASKTNVSLEALASEKRLNLTKALGQNPFLKSIEVQKMALNAVSVSNNSPDFNKSLRATIAAQASLWAGFAKTNKLDEDEKVGQIAANQSAEPQPPQPVMPPPTLAAADLRSGDALLLEAQNLADNKRYREAITKAALIPETNPLFPSAQDKIVSFSNLAVQELRQKAAQAFQNALPVADPKAKAAYLEEARKHLSEALLNYPKAPAEQLTTVRENLAIISRDLERLGGDRMERR